MANVAAELVAQCLAGNPSAQKTLFDSYCPRVHRLAVRMVGPAEAPDVTQQIFVQVFRKLVSFRNGADFSTWLYRVAVNECLQHSRRVRLPVAALTEEPPATGLSAERRLELAELLQWALQRLEEKLRTVFLLREVEELSYEQIAEVLEIPAGTVASQLNRARAELKRLLGPLVIE